MSRLSKTYKVVSDKIHFTRISFRAWGAILVLLLSTSAAQARQPADSLRNPELGMEFFWLNASFSQLRQTALTLSYRLSRGGEPGLVLDSSEASYLVHEGMMSGEMDGVRLLRNNRYSLSVNTGDSLIAISRVVTGAGTLQINVFDSLFRAVNIEGFDKTAVPGGSRLSVSFRPDGFYKNYSVTYNNDYRIEKVVLEYLDTEFGDNGLPPPPGSTRIMEVRYGGYQTVPFDISIFNEGQYVRKDEYGKWVGVGAFAGWQVMASQPDL